MKQSGQSGHTSKVDKNAVVVVHTNSHCKEEVVHHVQPKISIIVSMFLSLPHCALNICNWELVNYGAEYRLEVPANFHFYGPEKATKFAKK